ncbi:tRNA-modifying protein YgfZ [Vibrio sp.]|uniref:tRNA-modifying protein YgfZ n=1 Tax=Vibrio viridaestus TaxID=2487322 RepID=A0A3N9U6Q6_9VIBR|nr:tRNA-modifying protein YgfZ [Vibrio viridaestus]MDC0610638.1 tRNA-modifying protein YgfZ [Vibrio sp.]RQW63766.1 tRNA-modifying protein YgfZ [Vibrio viridaestus]
MDWKNRFQSLTLQESAAQTDLALAYLSTWGLITATGADKKSYLQGQITCNVASLSAHDVTFAGHCDAKGKVWSIFRMFHHKDGYAMVQPKSVIDTELKELKKYAVFSKIEITESEDNLLAIFGADAESFVKTLSSEQGDVRSISGGTAVKINDQRWLLVVDDDAAQSIVEQLADKIVSELLWLEQEIKHGIPVLNAQEQNTHIPQALNLQAIDGISFTKGCYTGQETVARAKYRGINKRALYTISGNLSTSPENVEIERSVGENWRSVGNLIAFIRYPSGKVIGQIVLPNNLDSETKFRAKDQEGEWILEPMPYQLEEAE